MNTRLFTKIVRTTIAVIFILGTMLGPTTSKVAASGNPQISIHIYYNQIIGFNWSPGNPDVVVRIDDPVTSMLPDFTSPMSWDPSGYHFLNLGGTFQLQPGQVVTMSDGTTTKSIIVIPLSITKVDPATDIVEGQTAPGVTLSVDCGPDSLALHDVTSENNSGIWSVDFSKPGNPSGETCNITSGSNGQAYFGDQDGDTVQVNWNVPIPRIHAHPQYDLVFGFDWPMDTPLTMTITGDGVSYSDSNVMMKPDPGYPGHSWSDTIHLNGFDLLPGQEITIADGGVTKLYAVADTLVTEIDTLTDKVSGIATPGNRVIATVSGGANGNIYRATTADSSGMWTVDFSKWSDPSDTHEIFTLQPGSNGWAYEENATGDQTWANNWYVPNPFIRAFLSENRVDTYGWPLNTTLTLAIDGTTFPTSPTTVSCSWDATCGYANFDLGPDFTLAKDQTISITDGSTTKTLTVMDLYVDSYDPINKTVSGHADPNEKVGVNVWIENGHQDVWADDTGSWQASYKTPSGPFLPWTQGDVYTWDEDEDATIYRINMSYISYWPGGDVGFDDCTKYRFYTLSIDFLANEPENDITENFQCGLSDDGSRGSALVPYEGPVLDEGDKITISSGHDLRTLVLPSRGSISFDTENDIVSGVNQPNSYIRIMPSSPWEWGRNVLTGGTGEWSVDFSEPGQDGEPVVDILPGMNVSTLQYDADGDNRGYGVPNPVINAFLSENRIDAHNWPLNTPLTLTIDGTPFPANPTTVPCSWDTACGYANFDLGPDFTLAPDQTISITDGSTTKTLTVMDLYVDSYDPINKTVQGYAVPGAKVGVNVWIDKGYQDVWADGTTGSWQASYYTPSGPFLPWTAGDVTTWDEDGDATVYRINNGNIFATPEADYIELQNVTKYRTYTLKINDPTDGLFYTDTRQSQLGEGETHGDVIFPLSGFDLDAGDQITITSGHDVRSLVVAPRGTISFNTANDTITGTNLQDNWLGIGTPAAWRDVKTASSGDWSIDYKEIGSNGAPVEDIYPGMDGNTYEGDSDWDFTVYNWHIPNPRFDVRANFDQIEGYEWTLGETVTLTIDNPETGKTPDYSTTEKVVVASWDPNQTYVLFNLSGTYDIQPGDEVTLSVGTITKTTTVANLSYTDFDLAADAVSGVASPDTLVHIGVCDATGCYYRHLITDENGAWVADFARPGSEPDEQNIFDIIPGTWVDTQQYDDDGDGTLFGLNIPNPIIRAWPNRDQVDADGWTPGETVTLQVGGHELKGTAQAAYWDPNNGFVKFQLSGIVDIKPGILVSLTNGKITKTTVVTNVQITNVDVNNDTVRGTAVPGTNVDVWASYADNWFVRHATADEHGNWAVDFAHPGSGPDEQDPFDIIYWTWIEADQADEDSDLSMYGTVVPTPFNIYAMDTKTGVSSQLTQLPASGEYFPSWSPDGKYVAEGVIGIGYLGVYITNVATGKSEPLRGADGGFDPAWSPNGKWIAFFRGWMDEPNLYYVPAAGGEKKLIRENADDASWAPNSQRLVFQDLADGNKIKTVSLSGTGETIVADHGANPAWSPSGEWIAFEQDGNIWKVRVNLQGVVLGSPVQLTSGSVYKGFPAWSADEKWIVFQSGTEDNYSLWKIPAGGGTPVKVAGAPIFGDAENPSYSVNGRYLAFSGITSYPLWRNWISPSKGDFLPRMWTNHNHRNQFIPNHTFPDRTIRLKSMVARALQFEYRIKSLMQYHRQP